MRLASIICILLLVGCATPFVGHAHTDGKSNIHFDGRYLSVEGTGTVEVGITDKAGNFVYPAGAPLKLTGDFRKGYDVRGKKEIPFDEAAKLNGSAGSHPSE